MKKGISPLAVSVILVAVTVVIAAILSYWATNLVKDQTNTEDGCVDAGFRLYSGNYDNSTNTLYLVLDNQRTTDLNDLTIYLFYPQKKIVEKSLEGMLEANNIKSFKITVEEGFNSGVI